MKKYFLFLALSMGLTAVSLAAEELPTKSVENRFLFVIETSASASRSAKSARETVRSLIESGVQGQMRPGDTLGLWTFNEQLYASFPMQQWSPAVSTQIGERTDEFLKKIRFEKKSRLNVILPPMESVVQASKAITVILVSGGNEPIQGTPFDQEINAVYSVYARSLRDSKLPFVTILVGRNGKLVSYAVNSALDAIQIPNLPVPVEPDLARIKANELARTNKVAGTATDQVARPRKIAKANIILTKPVVTNQPPLTNAVGVANEEVKSVAEKTNSLVTTISTNVLEASSKVSAPVSETNSISPPAKVVTAPANSVPSVATQAVAVISTQATNISTTTEKAATRSLVESPAVKIDDPTTSKPQSQNVSSVANGMAGQSAPAPMVATQSLTTPRNFILIGASLLVIAGLLAFLLFRNSRGKSQPSLISRSMNQPPK